MDATTIDRLTAARKATPNVLAPDWAGKWSDNGKGLWLAGPPVRALAQNLIDRVADADGVACHAHLAEARILVLIRTGQKANADGLLELGKAGKASPRDRVLADGADFVITLNGDAWELVPDLDPDEKPSDEQLAALHLRQIYTLDHELTHCWYAVAAKTFKLAGKRGAKNRDKWRAFEKALGTDHLGTDEDGDLAVVRFVKRKADADGVVTRPPEVEASGGKLALSPRCWRIRKHDLEDWTHLMARYGADGPKLKRLCQAMHIQIAALAGEPVTV